MTSAQDPILQSRIANWRARALSGDLTLEECREALTHLRAGRVSASVTSETARRRKAKAEVPSADDLLDSL